MLDFLVANTMFLFARLWHRCRAGGRSPLRARGPALVIANHPSHADPAFLMCACRRRIHFLQAREYYEVFALRRFFHLVGCIPVTRGGRDVGAIRTALECLREGAVVGIFPEGDITPPRTNRLRRGQTGAALLALRSGAPVLPASITGAPRGHGVVGDWVWPSRGVRVRFGPPVDLSAYRGLPITHALLRAVTDLLMQRIAEFKLPSPVAQGSERRVRVGSVPPNAQRLAPRSGRVAAAISPVTASR